MISFLLYYKLAVGIWCLARIMIGDRLLLLRTVARRAECRDGHYFFLLKVIFIGCHMRYYRCWCVYPFPALSLSSIQYVVVGYVRPPEEDGYRVGTRDCLEQQRSCTISSGSRRVYKVSDDERIPSHSLLFTQTQRTSQSNKNEIGKFYYSYSSSYLNN